MAFSDYSATPANNTTIAGQNVAPGGPPAAVGPAIRQLMADGRSLQQKLEEVAYASDRRFAGGAPLNGVDDDAPAIKAALAVAKLVLVPSTAGGVRLASGFTIPEGRKLEFMGGQSHLVQCDNDDDQFTLSPTIRISGGDFRGMNRPGRLFVCPAGVGRWRIDNFLARIGWVDPILRRAMSGGSQSAIENFVIGREGAVSNQASPKFAIEIEDIAAADATPMFIVNGNFDGKPSISFGGCNVVMLVNTYLADYKVSTNSRAVLGANPRTGNVLALDISGANHQMLGDHLPRYSLTPGTDNTFIAGSFNRGYVRDLSGNGRNSLLYWSHPVVLVLSSDANPLGLNSAYHTIARAGSIYHLQFYFTLDNFGPGVTYIGLPDGAYTSCPVEQYGTAVLRYTAGGQSVQEVVSLRILPADGANGGRNVQIQRANGSSVSQNNPAGASAITLSGNLLYSA